MMLKNTWTSFFKSRLNCSIPGEFPFYFNEIRKYNMDDVSPSSFLALNFRSTLLRRVCVMSIVINGFVIDGKHLVDFKQNRHHP